MKTKAKSAALDAYRTRTARTAAKSPKRTTRIEETEARLNVTLPVSLHQAIKIEAAKRGQTIRALIIELLTRQGIRRNEN